MVNAENAKKPISGQYLLVEIISSAIFVFLLYYFGLSLDFLLLVIFAMFFVGNLFYRFKTFYHSK